MANFFKKHKCNKYCKGLLKPKGDKIPPIVIPKLGSGTGTRSMSLKQTGTELLKSIDCDPVAFKKIFAYLKKFECGKQIKQAIKDAVADEGGETSVIANKAAEMLEDLEFD